MIEGFGSGSRPYLWLVDPDPGGPKKMWIRWIRIRNTGSATLVESVYCIAHAISRGIGFIEVFQQPCLHTFSETSFWRVSFGTVPEPDSDPDCSYSEPDNPAHGPFTYIIRIPCAGCVSAWRACATRTKTLCTSCTPSSRTSPSPRAASRASRQRMSRPRNRESYSCHQPTVDTAPLCFAVKPSFFWINNDISNIRDLSEVYFWHFQVVLVKMGTDDGGSRIFAGYRPLGYVSNDVPCITRWVGTTVVFFLNVYKWSSDLIDPGNGSNGVIW